MDGRGKRALTGAAATLGLVVPGVALIALMCAVVLGVNAAALLIDEGAVPPISRMPDVPDGAEITHQEKECASGGCWWEVTITPPPGQTPDDLAAAMGVHDDLRFPATLLHPREAYLESEPVDSELHVILGYTDPFA